MARKPQPTEIKKAKGNPGGRPLNEDEPVYSKKANPPDWLSDRATAEWYRLAPELESMGLLQSVDRAVMAEYCEAWAEVEWAELDIQANGRIMQFSSGYQQQRPSVGIRNKAHDRIRKCSALLGLSPSDRQSIKAENKATAGQDDAFKFPDEKTG
jgi:P27 family predicted phage terminase small subunit